MGARAKTLTVWSDLEPAGGSPRGGVRHPVVLSEAIRTDGDDRLSVGYARSENPALSLQLGDVLRLELVDSTVGEWIANEVHDDLVSDQITATALPAKLWLAERVLVRSGTTTTFNWSGYLDDLIDDLIATDEWPAWAIRGTVSRTPFISVSLDAANGLQALLTMLAAANAHDDVKLFGETLRFVFRRVSPSQYAVDFTSTTTSGTPPLISKRTITPPRIRQARGTQVQSVLPLGASGAEIDGARYLVRSIVIGTKRLELRDWSYRADRLVVVYDGQWVGDYLIAPDGDAFQITDSFAGTQEVECSSIGLGDFGTDDVVQIASDSGGTAITEVAAAGAPNPRRVLLQGDWTSKVNWARNAQWRDWSGGGGTKPGDWTDETLSLWTLSQETDPTYIETGQYSLKVVTNGTAGTRSFRVNAFGWPDEFLSPGGGSQTWRVGMRYFKTGVGANLLVGISVNGGSSWTHSGGTGTGVPNEWVTAETTAITTGATGRADLLIRISSTTTSATYYVDRVWLFRDGIDTGDNTVVGCDPARGVYEANRLLQKRLGDVTYEFTAIDRYRADPTAFPHDRLEVGQFGRFMVPERGIDELAEIAELERDHLRPYITKVRVGALRRRLIDTLRA